MKKQSEFISLIISLSNVESTSQCIEKWKIMAGAEVQQQLLKNRAQIRLAVDLWKTSQLVKLPSFILVLFNVYGNELFDCEY